MTRSPSLSIVSLAGALSLAAWTASATVVPIAPATPAAADASAAPAAPATPAAPAAPATPAAADAASQKAPEAQIPFANRGGIWNWQVINNNTVLIESRSRKWYKATLFGNCINLSFAQELTFDSSPNGTFDKFSAIRVRGQRCPLVSLVETDAPPKKNNAKKPAPATAPPAAPASSGGA
jgi:hypothetical protein